jgi:hypothetical protein
MVFAGVPQHLHGSMLSRDILTSPSTSMSVGTRAAAKDGDGVLPAKIDGRIP